ncbi:hypothetical protein DAI22_05g032700 [Oryza sativa Japonica Group]|nr:hypothetical protein DAI22_05g032700 [Oryza sativa Japonica Group]
MPKPGASPWQAWAHGRGYVGEEEAQEQYREDARRDDEDVLLGPSVKVQDEKTADPLKSLTCIQSTEQ